jgi:hypothetical protein
MQNIVAAFFSKKKAKLVEKRAIFYFAADRREMSLSLSRRFLTPLLKPNGRTLQTFAPLWNAAHKTGSSQGCQMVCFHTENPK